MVLTHAQARKFYDRFGRMQDTQAFYEDAALADLVAHAAFAEAEQVLELGCGTGRLAARLLATHLPPAATYLGLDLSPTMVGLAQVRLAPYAGRAQVVLSDGALRFPLPAGVVDRVVATYVLDLLSEADIRQALAEAGRVLRRRGTLCLVSLTPGVTAASRLVGGLWAALFRLHAPLVGGCRPIQLLTFVDARRWVVLYRRVVTQWGVSSEVVIARPRDAPAAGGPPDMAERHTG